MAMNTSFLSRTTTLLSSALVAVGCSTGPNPPEQEKTTTTTSAQTAHPADSCAGPGAACEASFDCCNDWCVDGKCHQSAGECAGPGAACEASFDCCNDWCVDGKCHR
jgi:hypothetical protein